MKKIISITILLTVSGLGTIGILYSESEFDFNFKHSKTTSQLEKDQNLLDEMQNNK